MTRTSTRGLVSKKARRLALSMPTNRRCTSRQPAATKLLLDEDTGGISLTDQNSNSIAMTKDGIAIKSARVLTIEASKEVTLTGSKVNIK